MALFVKAEISALPALKSVAEKCRPTGQSILCLIIKKRQDTFKQCSLSGLADRKQKQCSVMMNGKKPKQLPQIRCKQRAIVGRAIVQLEKSIK